MTVMLDNLIMPENIILEPAVSYRDDLFSLMAKQLASSGFISENEVGTVCIALREREEKGSTAIGNGLAIPHARIDSLEHVVGAFARVSDVDGFNSIDGAPVNFVFLILSPTDQQTQHFEALSTISRMMNNPACRSAIETGGNAQTIYEAMIHSTSHA